MIGIGKINNHLINCSLNINFQQRNVRISAAEALCQHSLQSSPEVFHSFLTALQTETEM